MEIPAYYALFELPVRLLLDETLLRSRFLALNRRFHPDFFTLEPEAKQAEALAKSTEINQAYQTLNDFDRRLRYVLGHYGAIGEEGQEKMDPLFLGEMMEANEALMELEFGFDEAVWASLKQLLESKENDLLQAVRPALEAFDGTENTLGELFSVKEYFLKKRYLLRIRENLLKFAPTN